MSVILNIFMELQINQISDSELILKGKTVFQSFTGSGFVGNLASYHLIQSLDLDEVAFIESDLIPNVAVVRDGVVKHPMRIFQNDRYIAVVNNANITKSDLKPLIKLLFKTYKEGEVSRVYVLGGLPTGRRGDADELPYHLGTSDEKLREEILSKTNLSFTTSGLVFGSVALSLLQGYLEDINVISILSDCIPELPDYLAAFNVLTVFEKIALTGIDLTTLKTKASSLRQQLISLSYDDEYDDDLTEDKSKFK